jgi:hypothetical protein
LFAKNLLLDRLSIKSGKDTVKEKKKAKDRGTNEVF